MANALLYLGDMETFNLLDSNWLLMLTLLFPLILCFFVLNKLYRMTTIEIVRLTFYSNHSDTFNTYYSPQAL